MLTDPGARLDFVRFHVSQRVWAATELPESARSRRRADAFEVSRHSDRVTVGEAAIAEADLAATNSVVHVLDALVWVPG